MKFSFLVAGLIGVLMGILLLWIPVDFLISLMFIVFGVLTLLSAIPAFFVSLTNRNDRGYLLNIILSALSVAFGIVLIFWHNDVLMILLGAYMLVFPLIRILISGQKKQQLKTELPRMILGLVMILVGPGATVSILLRIAGVVVIVLSILYTLVSLLITLFGTKKEKAASDGRIYVDVDGDGVVDAVESAESNDKN